MDNKTEKSYLTPNNEKKSIGFPYSKEEIDKIKAKKLQIASKNVILTKKT